MAFSRSPQNHKITGEKGDTPHILMTFNRRVISSTGITSPVPEPGQTWQVRSQSSGVATLLSQNGQVRHWGGRTE